MKVSAIVCAFNEEKTIKSILEILATHPQVDEVVVVDDGSTDATWEVITSIKHPILVTIRHPQNQGKGAAVATAIRRARNEILLFVDADLKGFHRSHIDLLLAPLQIDLSIMTIGIIEVASRFEKNFRTLLKSFSGVRAIGKRFLLPIVDRIEVSGYGVELIVNLWHIRHGRDIVYVPLPRLIHRTKVDKHPFYRYISDYLRENSEVIKQYFVSENKTLETFLKQITKKLGIQ